MILGGAGFIRIATRCRNDPCWPGDVISNVVNLYVTGTVTGLIILPILVFFPEHFLGRKLIMASPEQLGPIWLQVAVIMVSVSLFRYWMHRMQHTVPFLWELHAYHHRVTDLQATNTYVSHPIDFALRNVLIFLVLGIIGFSPFALLLAVPASNISGTFSHCGGDVKAGLLNYVFVTPEVHRWHHSAQVPEGYGYSCNYGVEFSFWDIIFRDVLFAPEERRSRATGAHRVSGRRIARRGQLPEIIASAVGAVPPAILVQAGFADSRRRPRAASPPSDGQACMDVHPAARFTRSAAVTCQGIMPNFRNPACPQSASRAFSLRIADFPRRPIQLPQVRVHRARAGVHTSWSPTTAS